VAAGSEGKNILDYTASTTAVTVDFGTNAATGTAGMSAVTQIIGSTANALVGGNRVIGGKGDLLWSITGTGAGSIDGVSFARINHLTAGAGDQTLDYSVATSGVTVNLATGSATGFTSVGGFRRVIGSDFNDTITGDSADNLFTGGKGVNTLVGGGGFDTVSASSDADMVLTDTLLTVGASGVLGRNILSGISNAILTGGAGNNVLDASSFTGSVSLLGGAGDDTLKGGTGDDIISGGAGVDTIDGGGGDNTLIEYGTGRMVLTDTTLEMGEGASAVQSLTRGAGVTGGTFTLTYAGETTRAIPWNATADVVRSALIDLTTIGIFDVDVTLLPQGWSVAFTGDLSGRSIASLTAAGGGLIGGTRTISVATTTAGVSRPNTLTNIQRAILFGNDGDNLLDASAFTKGSVVLSGGAGADTVIGSTSGGDILSGGEGNDRLSGGGGVGDSLDGGTDEDGEDVDLVFETRNATTMVLTDTSLTFDGVTQTLVGFEWAQLTGGDSNNSIDASGFSGSVQLDGGAGDDTLIGGAGDDVLTGGAGADDIRGGRGTDTLVETRDANMTLTNWQLAIGTETDTFAEIENVVLSGGAGVNTLDASAYTLGGVTLRTGGG
ncbi:MAG: calcium-binding protein, partial [Actinomycetota bacterium]